MGKGAGGSAVEPLPPITARTDAATVIVPVPPVGQRRPTSGGGGGGTPGGGGSGVSGRPGSGGVRRAPSRPGSGGGGGGDVEALAEEVRELESKLQRAAKRRGSGDQQRPRSAPRSPARAAAADESADFQQLLAQVRKESQATLVAMDSAGAQKGSLQQQVAALQEQLKQVTIKEMDIVEQLSVELKENVELKKSLAKCEEELAVQRALNDEELGMVDELASMEEERNRLRVDVEKLRAAAAPLQETITELQEDKTELAQLLQQSEARIKVLGDQLQGGAELFDNKEKELRAFEAETAEKLRFLDKKITSLEEDLSTTQETLATTQATLERTEAELELTKKTAAAAAATAAAQYADMTAQYEKVADIVASTKAKCEEEVAHARSDRTIIVKELRRLQEKERETRDINAVREAETQEYRRRMEDAQEAMEESSRAEAIAQGKLQDALDDAQRERDRSAAMEAEVARVNDLTEGRHLALDAQHGAMNERMAEMERTMAANLHEVRGREEEANRRVAEVDARIEEVRLDLVQKTADCVRLDESLKALEEGSSKAWTDLVEQHEQEIQKMREAEVERLAKELEEQEGQLNQMWQKRLDDETSLHQTTAKNLAEERASLQESQAENRTLTELLETTRSQLTNAESGWERAKQRIEKVEGESRAATASLQARQGELLEARSRVSALEAAIAQRDLSIAGQEEEKAKLRDEVKYMEEKLVAARTDKLDAIADMQVRNVLLEKELVVRNEQAGLNGEAKVRLQRDQDRQRQRVAEMGRTIDFLRSDVRRLDEERIELRETYRKDMQRLTAERDGYMDEVDRMAFIMTERNATSEEVLTRAKGEGDGLGNKLDVARGLFDSILFKLENPEDGDDQASGGVSVSQPLGGLFGAAGGGGPGSVRVSVDVRAPRKKGDEFDSDSEDDGAGAQASSTLGGTANSFSASGMPKTEELLEGVTTDQWNRRKERRARRKRELESLRRQLRESDAERAVLTRALQDLTRNLAQLRFTGETVDTVAPPQFVMQDGQAVKPRRAQAQPGIGGAAAAGSRRAASRTSSRGTSAIGRASQAAASPSRADSRASLVDAAAGARPSGRAPPPTHFNYGPSLPPPPQEAYEGDGAGAEDAVALPGFTVTGGAIGSVPPTVEVSKEPPNLDEIFDYATYLGLDTALDHELLWIAEEALCCPLPTGWTEHTDSEGNVYFHHGADDVSTYEHPMDKDYKALAARAKADKSEEAIGELRDEILQLKRQFFIHGETGAEVPVQSEGDAAQLDPQHAEAEKQPEERLELGKGQEIEPQQVTESAAPEPQPEPEPEQGH